MNTTVTQRSDYIKTSAAVSALAFAVSAQAQEEAEKTFLQKIASEDADERFEAWRSAQEQDASVIEGLADLLESDNPGVVKAAREAILDLAHSVGKEVDNPKRAAVIQHLTDQLVKSSNKIRTVALRTLSLIAGAETVPEVVKFGTDEDLKEEAVFCLERIPGADSTKALMALYPDADDTFKIRILAALGNRGDETALELAGKEMSNANGDIAVAAMDAVAKIGKEPSSSNLRNLNELTPRQQNAFLDSMFRYYDARIAEGQHGAALKFYGRILKKENVDSSEHHRCAAVVSLSRILDAPEAKELVSQAAQNDTSYIVKTTATKVLNA